MLAFFAMIAIPGSYECGSMKRTARLDLAAFREGILLFRQETGRAPKTLDELVPRYVREVHRDSWGNDYRFTSDGGTTEIRSAGPNGRYGDEDDIVLNVDTGKLR